MRGSIKSDSNATNNLIDDMNDAQYDHTLSPGGNKRKIKKYEKKNSEILTTESAISSMFLSEEENLEQLLKSSTAFLNQDLDEEVYFEYYEDDDSANSTTDHDDELSDDLSRLAAAEEDIRMELEMLMKSGFGEISPDPNNGNKETSVRSHDESASKEYASSSFRKKKSKKKQSKSLQKSMADDHNETINNSEEIGTSMNIPQTFDNCNIEPVNEEINWREKAEELGIQRITLEDSEKQTKYIYQCPLRNSIYDLILEKDTNSLLNFDQHDVSISQEQQLQPPASSSNNYSIPKLTQKQQEILFLCNSEYIEPQSFQTLQTIYAGLVPLHNSNSNSNIQTTISATSNSMKDQAQKDTLQDENTILSQLKPFPEDILEPFPIRTCALRIRTDVLCGAVMDGLLHIVLTEHNGEIQKRQGGHLIAILPGFWIQKKRKKKHNHHKQQSSQVPHDEDPVCDNGEMIYNDDVGDTSSVVSKKKKKKKRKIFIPPLCMDAQLCTKKREKIRGDICERILLIRFYEMKEDLNSTIDLENGNEKEIEDHVKEKQSVNDILSDAAYILYQLAKEEEEKRVVRKGKGVVPETLINNIATIRDSKYVSKIGRAITSPVRVLTNISSPDVSNNSKQMDRKKRLKSIFSTSAEPLLQSALNFMSTCISELETRGLLYTTLLLPSSKFGMFPSLSTLDAHYCSQLRLICREFMLQNLLKTAAGLEQFAREMEVKCVKFVRVLVDGVIQVYGLELPSVPQLVPLTAYPLNFTSPDVKNPPWGQKVMEALQAVSISCSETNYSDKDSNNLEDESVAKTADVTQVDCNITDINTDVHEFDRASDAVQKVINAFREQGDEELAARVGRKNLQVMDRMMKMQGMRRRALLSIRTLYGRNAVATKAADHFNSMAIKARVPLIHSDNESSEIVESASIDNLYLEQCQPPHAYTAIDQVPILKCGVIAENSSGVCYVTGYQILFATNSGFLSGKIYTLFSIADIVLTLVENPTNSLFHSTQTLSLSLRIQRKFGDNTENERRHSKKSILSQHKDDEDWILKNTIEAYSFIPSLAPDKFKSFIDMVATINEE